VTRTPQESGQSWEQTAWTVLEGIGTGYRGQGAGYRATIRE
jgi:hypothetical protein